MNSVYGKVADKSIIFHFQCSLKKPQTHHMVKTFGAAFNMDEKEGSMQCISVILSLWKDSDSLWKEGSLVPTEPFHLNVILQVTHALIPQCYADDEADEL